MLLSTAAKTSEMDHEVIQELLPLAALGCLENEERGSVEQHLESGCESCSVEFASFRETLAALALLDSAPDREERVWSRLELRTAVVRNGHAAAPAEISLRSSAKRPRSSVLRRRIVGYGLTAAASLLIGLLLGLGRGELIEQAQSDQIAQLTARANELQGRLRAAYDEGEEYSPSGWRGAELSRVMLEPDGLKVELEARARLTNVMMAPDTKVIALDPVGPAPAASGMVTVSAKARTVILEVGGLPPVPPGQVYELWWIEARRPPIKAATFRTEADGDAIVIASLPPGGPNLLASAVTLEPSGGRELPTGPTVLRGEVHR